MMHDIVRDTPIYQIILREGLREGLEKGMEKGMEKGIEKGLEKGREKGLEEGKLLAMRTLLIDLVQRRFPGLAAQVQERMLAIQQSDVLEELTLHIALSQTVEEAQACLQVE